jgi:PadR family transcriptional regulator, regulatory protein PadR
VYGLSQVIDLYDLKATLRGFQFLLKDFQQKLKNPSGISHIDQLLFVRHFKWCVYDVGLMKTKPNNALGQFEQLVITAVIALGDNAYGLAIQRKVEELYGNEKEVNLGSVHVTLDRLAVKKFVESWVTEPLPERGGRSRRCFRVTETGKRALQESISVQQRSLALLTEHWRIS